MPISIFGLEVTGAVVDPDEEASVWSGNPLPRLEWVTVVSSKCCPTGSITSGSTGDEPGSIT